MEIAHTRLLGNFVTLNAAGMRNGNQQSKGSLTLKSTKEVKEWLMALEAERHDTSWRKPVERSYQPEVIYRDRPVDHRYRDSIMFHAGRWAAGARDLDAARANRVVGKMIKGTK